MILKLKPIFLQKVWGGNTISLLYNLNEENIGECWGISAHPSNSNKIEHPDFSTYSFKELFQEKKELFGNYPSNEFPILIKYIDAAQDLSIQVHPNDSYAKRNEESLGKEECWYILDAKPDTKIIIGNHAKDRDSFKKHIENNVIMNIINEYPISKRDYFYIPSGTLHAIKANTFLLEVSQSSDITYRIYDYDRLDNGKLRDLHIEGAIKVTKVPDDNLIQEHQSSIFTFDIIDNTSGVIHKAHKYGDYISVINGIGYIGNYPIKQGDFFMVTSDSDYRVEGNLTYALVNLV